MSKTESIIIFPINKLEIKRIFSGIRIKIIDDNTNNKLVMKIINDIVIVSKSL